MTLCLLCLCLPIDGRAAANYEDSLKQLAESVTAEAVKAKKRRLAFVEFTDRKGLRTPIGQFLTDELATQLLVGGEVQVAERALLSAAMKELHLTRIDPAHAKAAGQAAKRANADLFVTGAYMETADGVQITMKLIRPRDAQIVGAARGTLPKTGPLAELVKEAAQSPVSTHAASAGPKNDAPIGLGLYRNDFYELVVQSLTKQDRQATLQLTVESKTARDMKILCMLPETFLRDDQGKVWTQRIEDNREGLCARGLELSPRQKERIVLTFTAPPDSTGSEFALQIHEKSPRRDTVFTIDGLKPERAAPVAH
jgi:hypothetical protein